MLPGPEPPRVAAPREGPGNRWGEAGVPQRRSAADSAPWRQGTGFGRLVAEGGRERAGGRRRGWARDGGGLRGSPRGGVDGGASPPLAWLANEEPLAPRSRLQPGPPRVGAVEGATASCGDPGSRGGRVPAAPARPECEAPGPGQRLHPLSGHRAPRPARPSAALLGAAQLSHLAVQWPRPPSDPTAAAEHGAPLSRPLLPTWFRHQQLLAFLSGQWTGFILFLPKDVFIFKASLHILIV